jgi:hypothetical protein
MFGDGGFGGVPVRVISLISHRIVEMYCRLSRFFLHWSKVARFDLFRLEQAFWLMTCVSGCTVHELIAIIIKQCATGKFLIKIVYILRKR